MRYLFKTQSLPKVINILVKKIDILILLSRQSKTIHHVIAGWLKMAREECYNELAIDMMVNSFTERYLKRIRLF